MRYILADIVPFEDENRDTQLDIASNPNTRPATLAKLYEDTLTHEYRDMYMICHKLAANPSTPIDILYKLASRWKIPSYQAQFLVNPSLPLDFKRKLLQEASSSTFTCVLTIPTCPADVLALIATDGAAYLDDQDVLSLVRHENIPPEIRDDLIQQYEIGTDLYVDFKYYPTEFQDAINKADMERELYEYFSTSDKYCGCSVEYTGCDYDESGRFYYDYTATVYFELLLDYTDAGILQLFDAIFNIINENGGEPGEFGHMDSCGA